ncbi:MAG: 50S ribosomal protein L4 [Verrucomicrobiae bacterium]|jgi:large subunit ribosomal protein L4|nr:50S ribosomal protein L4 [Verrucomicrobiae bacterium]PAW85508.1 MAG: 50S ribosomal protein L4 [Opitutae bacterium Tous-C2FEB]PAZ02569.1 MAG: 50S ribosomal protein L4 [Opitutae bacterium AMD-G3]
MKLKVYKTDGSSFTEKEFDIPSFEGDKGVALLKQVIVSYQANKRQGTSKTKDYGEVAGSGKKMLPQKGSGGSRHGDKRAPQLYKGGIVFGPRPRDWSKTITVQAKKIALQRALFDLANDGGLAVIERFEVAKPKTALFVKVLKNVSPEGKRLLVVDSTWSEPVLRASRNISRALFSNSSNLNALDLVKTPRVLITLEGLTKVLERTKN